MQYIAVFFAGLFTGVMIGIFVMSLLSVIDDAGDDEEDSCDE